MWEKCLFEVRVMSTIKALTAIKINISENEYCTNVLQWASTAAASRADHVCVKYADSRVVCKVHYEQTRKINTSVQTHLCTFFGYHKTC